MKAPMRVALVYSVNGIEKRNEFVYKGPDDAKARMEKARAVADDGIGRIIWGVKENPALRKFELSEAVHFDLGFTKCLS